MDRGVVNLGVNRSEGCVDASYNLGVCHIFEGGLVGVFVNNQSSCLEIVDYSVLGWNRLFCSFVSGFRVRVSPGVWFGWERLD